jgi:hypothetical protein
VTVEHQFDPIWNRRALQVSTPIVTFIVWVRRKKICAPITQQLPCGMDIPNRSGPAWRKETAQSLGMADAAFDARVSPSTHSAVTAFRHSSFWPTPVRELEVTRDEE